MRIDDVKLSVVKVEVRGEYIEVILRATDDRPGHIEGPKLTLHLKNPGELLLWDKYEVRRTWQ